MPSSSVPSWDSKTHCRFSQEDLRYAASLIREYMNIIGFDGQNDGGTVCVTRLHYSHPWVTKSGVVAVLTHCDFMVGIIDEEGRLMDVDANEHASSLTEMLNREFGKRHQYTTKFWFVGNREDEGFSFDRRVIKFKTNWNPSGWVGGTWHEDAVACPIMGQE